MSIKEIEPNKYHSSFGTGLKDVMRRHHNQLTQLEMLAIMANVLGGLAGFQVDMTPEMVMKVISVNLAVGLKEATEGRNQNGG